MTFRGYIKNGRVVVDEPIDLPDGTEMDLQPVTGSEARFSPARSAPKGGKSKRPSGKGKAKKSKGATTLFERYKSFIGKAHGLPSDFAAQHDHYIHGTRKR